MATVSVSGTSFYRQPDRMVRLAAEVRATAKAVSRALDWSGGR